MRKKLLIIILGISAIGFLYDVVSWAREGNHSLAEVLWQYWWAVLFLLSYGVAALVNRVRGANSGRGSSSPG